MDVAGAESPASAADGTSDREVRISRVVDAPRERVWDAMTDPKQIVHWWGPRGFTTTIQEMTLRPGGTWLQVMHGPDGVDHPSVSRFLEVVRAERLVYSLVGGRPGSPPVQIETTWTFEALPEGKTRVTILHVFPSGAERERVVRESGAVEGAHQTLERLEEFTAPGHGSSSAPSNT
jgi:uncharacterized protein YndB with AHSA1/START domain